MSEEDRKSLQEYNDRIDRERSVRNWVPPKDIPGSKFHPGGRIKPLYGMTCIAWIDQASALFETLCALQKTIQQDLEQVGLTGFFTFLDPKSFHMTICDIDAYSDPTLIHLQESVMPLKNSARPSFDRKRLSSF